MRATIIMIIFGICSAICDELDDHALFYKRSDVDKDKPHKQTNDTKDMDRRIENLLLWLQDKYKEKSRKTREDLTRMYLPAYASSTQAPRPFQTFDIDSLNNARGKDFSTGELPSLSPVLTNLNEELGSQYDGGFDSQKTVFDSQKTVFDSQKTVFDSQNTNNNPTQGVANTLDAGGVNDGPHPPHVHNINAECSKDQMNVNIEFNTPFNGIIYSKGHYNSGECRYVAPNSGQMSYRFTLLLNSCGTQFVDKFSEGQQAYLENTLVVQNEDGILEAWDSVHSVRCLWEGKISQSLSSGLNIGSLEQQLLTFNGDTGKARLEIQVGRGPFSHTEKSLVQLGDLMTLVITVEGDPQFNLKIGQCSATSSAGSKVTLTDSNGCPLKEKLMGAFQFARNPQDGASIAYAFFKAFKFPDEMDINFECQVELCKYECTTCQLPGLKYEPTRRRRDLPKYLAQEGTLTLHVNSSIRLFRPEDLHY